jgi:glycosyltransferase involved in cell wall biosynthesis
MRNKKKVLFYSSVRDKQLFFTQKFYQIDISILKKIGYEIQLSNKIYDAFFFWKYNFVFAYFYKKSFFVALIAYIFHRNTYFTGGIDDLSFENAATKRYRNQVYFMKLCYLISKSCIIVSKADLGNVTNILRGKKLSKISYSEHSIDVNSFLCNSGSKEQLFTTIVWMGGIGNVQRKGVDTAIKLFSKLKETKQFANYKFVIIGKKGAGTPYIESLIEQYSISDSVTITDKISECEKIDYLKRSQYYFQLSKYEGFGIAALEALFARNVVIHSGRGGLANPVYGSNTILFQIENDFDCEFQRLLLSINNIEKCAIEEACDKWKVYYDNERRKQDFIQIIHE